MNSDLKPTFFDTSLNFLLKYFPDITEDCHYYIKNYPKSDAERFIIDLAKILEMLVSMIQYHGIVYFKEIKIDFGLMNWVHKEQKHNDFRHYWDLYIAYSTKPNEDVLYKQKNALKIVLKIRDSNKGLKSLDILKKAAKQAGYDSYLAIKNIFDRSYGNAKNRIYCKEWNGKNYKEIVKNLTPAQIEEYINNKLS